MLTDSACKPNTERRSYQRAKVSVPFLYNLGESVSVLNGEWKEANTWDLGPALIGGLSFYSSDPIETGSQIHIALYTDLEKKRLLETSDEEIPGIHTGHISNVTDDDRGKKFVVMLTGFEPGDSESGQQPGCSVLRFD